MYVGFQKGNENILSHIGQLFKKKTSLDDSQYLRKKGGERSSNFLYPNKKGRRAFLITRDENAQDGINHLFLINSFNE